MGDFQNHIQTAIRGGKTKLFDFFFIGVSTTKSFKDQVFSARYALILGDILN